MAVTVVRRASTFVYVCIFDLLFYINYMYGYISNLLTKYKYSSTILCTIIKYIERVRA